VTFNSQNKRKSSVKPKRTSNITKIKYGRTSAKAQKRQIMSNALDIRRVKSMLPPPVWCDYQYKGIQNSLVVPGDDGYQLNYEYQPMLTPTAWQAVLRQDPNVDNAVTTKLLRMSINLRYQMRGSSRVQYSLFFVTLRKNAANKDLNTLVAGSDYIRGPADYQVRLNPAVFKVLYARDVSLTTNKWEAPPFIPGGSLLAGNPETTFKKGQVNLKLNHNIREPSGLRPWKQMTFEQFPYYQKIFLLTFMYQKGSGLNPGESATLEWDMLATTYNAG